MAKKTTGARRGRRPGSGATRLTTIAGLTQAQPTSADNRRGDKGPEIGNGVGGVEALGEVAARRDATAAEAVRAPVTGTTGAFEPAITELLRMKRDRLTPEVAQEILRLLIEL